MKNILTILADELHKHDSLVLATILETTGSTPQVVGASALFSPGGLVAGTLGGGIMEGDAQLRAAESLKNGQSVIYEFSLDADINDEVGAICGGSARILLDVCSRNNQKVFFELTNSMENRRPGVLVSLINSAEHDHVLIEPRWVEGNSIV